MRRSDREVVGLTNILAILDKCEIMRIGLCVDNQPYIFPMNFTYEVIDDKVFIYIHCASEGKKVTLQTENLKFKCLTHFFHLNTPAEAAAIARLYGRPTFY